ncbi:MAG: YtxH domain-containing protein [Fimbriimonadales bacterium]|nr:YtxH domain-containing protein [Fimbriimonadales bacterium]
MSEANEKNAMLYFLAGVGVGALIGAAAGLLLAPKAGAETREELAEKLEELKSRVAEWMRERRERKAAASVGSSTDEAGA